MSLVHSLVLADDYISPTSGSPTLRTHKIITAVGYYTRRIQFPRHTPWSFLQMFTRLFESRDVILRDCLLRFYQRAQTHRNDLGDAKSQASPDCILLATKFVRFFNPACWSHFLPPQEMWEAPFVSHSGYVSEHGNLQEGCGRPPKSMPELNDVKVLRGVIWANDGNTRALIYEPLLLSPTC